jgi:hypothetical protein
MRPSGGWGIRPGRIAEAGCTLSNSFQQLEARQVTELLAQLLAEREQLRSERDHWEVAFAAFHEEMRNLASEFKVFGGLRHIPYGLSLLESPTTFAEGTHVIREGHERATRKAAIWWETVQANAPTALRWSWCSVTSVLQALAAGVSWDASDDGNEDWGLFASVTVLRSVLDSLLRWTMVRPEFRAADATLDTRQRALRIVVRLQGAALPEACLLLESSPAIGDVGDWNLDMPTAAKLSAAARFLRSLGGTARYAKLAATTKRARQSVAEVTLEIPVTPRLPGS